MPIVADTHAETRLDSFLKAAEVCALAGFSKTTLWRLERSDRFPAHYVISTRATGYRRSEVEAWIADPAGWRSNGDAGSNTHDDAADGASETS